jgi:hypothetical protein
MFWKEELWICFYVKHILQNVENHSLGNISMYSRGHSSRAPREEQLRSWGFHGDCSEGQVKSLLQYPWNSEIHPTTRIPIQLIVFELFFELFPGWLGTIAHPYKAVDCLWLVYNSVFGHQGIYIVKIHFILCLPICKNCIFSLLGFFFEDAAF